MIKHKIREKYFGVFKRHIINELCFENGLRIFEIQNYAESFRHKSRILIFNTFFTLKFI